MTRSTRVFPVALVAACFSLACGDFVSIEEYDPLPEFEDLDLGQIAPADEYILWELRETRIPVDFRVVGGVGLQNRDTLDPVIIAEFDSLQVWGFGEHCLPASCTYYIASIGTSGIETWTRPTEVRTFLGSIENREEAMLLTKAHDYHWSSFDKATGAIRVIPDGFELVVAKTVKFCDPVQTNRYLVNITESGQLTVVKEEVWQREEGVCI